MAPSENMKTQNNYCSVKSKLLLLHKQINYFKKGFSTQCYIRNMES